MVVYAETSGLLQSEIQTNLIHVLVSSASAIQARLLKHGLNLAKRVSLGTALGVNQVFGGHQTSHQEASVAFVEALLELSMMNQLLLCYSALLTHLTAENCALKLIRIYQKNQNGGALKLKTALNKRHQQRAFSAGLALRARRCAER